MTNAPSGEDQVFDQAQKEQAIPGGYKTKSITCPSSEYENVCASIAPSTSSEANQSDLIHYSYQS